MRWSTDGWDYANASVRHGRAVRGYASWKHLLSEDGLIFVSIDDIELHN